MIVRVLAVAAALAAAAFPAAAFASTGTIWSFSSSGSSTLTFAVSDMAEPSMLPTSGAASFTLLATTSASTGTVTVQAPTVTGASGDTIAASAFTAKCTATSDSAGMFTSSGTVRLTSSAVTCGTLAANKTGQIAFTVTLTLDDTGDVHGFPADTFASGSLKVAANVP
ncbi:MAG TPA: hypothetical protein VHT53_08040 [Candidatus Elarobacter sp.]|jgi:hypothetical protein|nr:hypothetical protein [Candidatus Elarobacter sp.]